MRVRFCVWVLVCSVVAALILAPGPLASGQAKKVSDAGIPEVADAKKRLSDLSQDKVADERELIALETQWAEANVKRDWAFLDKVLADDYLQTNWDGAMVTKADLLALLRSGDDLITSSVNDELTVRLYGDVAVVRGRWTAKETLKGKDVSGRYRWTDTWIKRDGRWVCVASQNSKIV